MTAPTLRKLRHWRLLSLAAAAVTALLVGFNGLGTGIERWLAQESAVVRRHPASGQLHIVEIDARSIAAIDRWPWPRSQHARLIDRLREAGAASITFDVDFSSRSTAAEDGALAAALRRADGKVTLPTFRQAATGRGDGWIDALPAPALRDHASLAAVSVRPDSDGQVRNAPIGTVTAGTPRPSLSAMIAGRAGAAGVEFPIDYAVDPTSVPRHSFIDVRDGHFDPRAVAGRQVLVGATAVEIGDRYAVPGYGVIPGVVIQALAAETLMKGVPVRLGWLLPLLLGLVGGWAVVGARSRRALAAWAVAWPLLLFATAVGLQAALGWIVELVPALTAWLAATVVAGTRELLRTWHQRRTHDESTGLPNRSALIERASGGDGLMIVAARIADFEKLAAALGPALTAELVRRIVDRIRLVRSDVVVHRVDERALAWRAGGTFDQVDDHFATLRTLMLAPVEVGGRRVDVTLAVGVAQANDADVATTLAHAVRAAEFALEDGSGLHIHAAAEEAAMDRELSLLSELDDAVLRGELEVLFQPKLDVGTDAIVSVEALVRWHHPTRGFLRPDLFIPLAERHGRIAKLTLYVLERTVTELARWASEGHILSAAVNISAKLLTDAPFEADVRQRIAASPVPAARITFEVTESAAVENPDAAAATLGRFRALGLKISMDDYGTGQSTLTYLKRLPLDELKVDRSFVQFAHQNRSDGVLLRSTVEMAHELGLKVVAEGVETAECLAYLREIGCDLAQGYLISKPLESEALLGLIGELRQAA